MPLLLIAIYGVWMGILGLQHIKPMPHPPIPYSQEFWEVYHGK